MLRIEFQSDTIVDAAVLSPPPDASRGSEEIIKDERRYEIVYCVVAVSSSPDATDDVVNK